MVGIHIHVVCLTNMHRAVQSLGAVHRAVHFVGGVHRAVHFVGVVHRPVHLRGRQTCGETGVKTSVFIVISRNAQGCAFVFVQCTGLCTCVRAVHRAVHFCARSAQGCARTWV